MTVLFLHPPLQSPPSGGNIFNRHIIRQAGENHYPLKSFPIDKAQLLDGLNPEVERTEARLLIWDSLFFDILSDPGWKGPAIEAALLVHYLPSLNPACGPSLKKRLEQQEYDAIRKCARILCTGAPTFRAISSRFPELLLFLCKPGIENFFRPGTKMASKIGNKEGTALISVANFFPEKGLLDLLQVLSDLKEHPWTWHIVGSEHVDRSYSTEFRSAVLAANLAPRIQFHRNLNRRRLAVLLSEMDIFISASYYESYGMAIAEAVATGLPVVSTLTGAASELIDHERSGFVVPVGDLQSMKYSIEALIRSPELRHAFGLEARSKPRISWKNCFENFQKACDTVS